MPKQILEINPFHGGLNNNGDPRDIKVEELSQAQDIMVDEIGKVRTMGSHVAHDSSSKSVTITEGHGLFSFSHDRMGAHLDTEHLNETDFATHANWDVTGKCVDSGGNLTWTFGSGALDGTAQQVYGDRAQLGVPNIEYTFKYTVAVTTAPDYFTLTLDNFPSSSTTLPFTAGTHLVTFTSHSSCASREFTITGTDDVGGTTTQGVFSIDDVSLYITDKTGNNYLALANSDTGADIEIYSDDDDSWSSSSRIVLGDGSSTAGMKAVYYIADGNLRVSDGAFGSDKRVKWYGYIDRYFYGDGVEGLDSGGHGNGTQVSKWHSANASIEPLAVNIGISGATPVTSAMVPSENVPITLWAIGYEKEALDVRDGAPNTTTDTDKIFWQCDVDVSADQIGADTAVSDKDIDIENFVSVGDKVVVTASAGQAEANGQSINGQILTVASISTGSTNSFKTEETLGGADDNNDELYITNLSKSGWFDSTNPNFEWAVSTLYDDNKAESALFEIKYTGVHDGGDGSNHLDDADGAFPNTHLKYWVVENVTDDSTAVITSNTTTTVNGILSGGDDNDWDDGDVYKISLMTPAVFIGDNLTSGFNKIKFIPLLWADESTGLHITYPRVSGFKIYMRRQDSPTWYLQTELDVTRGIKLMGEGTWNMWADAYTPVIGNAVGAESERTTSMRLIESHQSETGFNFYNKNIGFNADGLGFATAVVANRRAYVGNVRIKDGGGNVKYLPDAILKSNVNAFDAFVFENRIEASINDGAKIIKLEEFADRLLEFKENKMTLINISQNVEFLEDVFMHKGVVAPSATCKTDYGIAWVNENGCYLYDGQRVNDLLEKGGVQIIKESEWRSFIGTAPMIGYVPKKRQLIVATSAGTGANNGNIYLYDLVTKSWVQGDSKLTDNVRQTNFITDWNGDLVHAHTSGTVVKWDDTSVATSNLLFATKDMTFGQPGQRKKLHKVYITYKGDASSLVAKYAIDGETDSGDFLQFNSTNTPLADKSSSENLEQWHLAELKPSTSSEANNLYSAKFHLSGSAGAGFEINDINVVFRMKNIK